MDDPYTAFDASLGIAKKPGQRLARLGDRVAMQVELGLDRDLSAPQLPDDALLESGAGEKRLEVGSGRYVFEYALR